MKANELLREVVASTGLFLDMDDCLMNMFAKDDGSEESYPLLSSQGYPYRLPTNKNINNMFKVKDGKPELQFLLFNPIVEDNVKLDTEALRSLIKCCKGALSMALYEVGYLMLQLVKDDKQVSKIGLELQKFLNDTNDRDSRVREQVDKNTFDKWVKVCTSPDEDALPILNLQIVRGGKIEGKDYNRLAGVDFPLFEAIYNLSGKEDETINGVKLRKKDIKIFQVLIKHLLGPIDDDFTCKEGSSHPEYPSFICLMRLYYYFMVRLAGFFKKLETFAQDTLVTSKVELNIDIDELVSNLDSMKSELANIPTEKDILAGNVQEEPEPAPKERTFKRERKYDDEEIEPYRGHAVPRRTEERREHHRPAEMTDNEKLNAMFGGRPAGYNPNGYIVQGGIVPETDMSRAIRAGSMGAMNIQDPNMYMNPNPYAQPMPPMNNFPAATYYGSQPMGYQPPMTPDPMMHNYMAPTQPQTPISMGNQFNIYGR